MNQGVNLLFSLSSGYPTLDSPLLFHFFIWILLVSLSSLFLLSSQQLIFVREKETTREKNSFTRFHWRERERIVEKIEKSMVVQGSPGHFFRLFHILLSLYLFFHWSVPARDRKKKEEREWCWRNLSLDIQWSLLPSIFLSLFPWLYLLFQHPREKKMA